MQAEIRKLERLVTKESVDSEYLRNVMFKFFTSEDEELQEVGCLCSLRFSADEGAHRMCALSFYTEFSATVTRHWRTTGL